MSTTSFIIFMGSNPISWSFKKKTTVSRLSTEAKYRALATTAAEVHQLRTLFKDLHLPFPYIPTLWCDNASTIALNSNPIFHARTKHIEVDFYFVREKVLHKDHCIRFVSKKDNPFDIFTKPLVAPHFIFL